MGFDLLGKKGRKLSRKVRGSLHLTSHNKFGRALKKLSKLMSAQNSANAYKSSYNGASLSSTYQHNGRTLSQLTGGV